MVYPDQAARAEDANVLFNTMRYETPHGKVLRSRSKRMYRVQIRDAGRASSADEMRASPAGVFNVHQALAMLYKRGSGDVGRSGVAREEQVCPTVRRLTGRS